MIPPNFTDIYDLVTRRLPHHASALKVFNRKLAVSTNTHDLLFVYSTNKPVQRPFIHTTTYFTQT